MFNAAWYTWSGAIHGSILIACVGFGHIASTSVNAGQKGDEPATDKAELLIRGMLSERERIESGIVHVRGKKIARSEGFPKVNDDVKALFAFDFKRQCFRFDSEVPMYVRSINNASVAAAGNDIKRASDDASLEFYNIILRYVRNDDYSAVWDRMGRNIYGAIHLRDPKLPVGGALASYHRLFDYRACGLASYMQFDSGNLENSDTVKEYCERLLTLPVVGVKEKNGTATIKFQTEQTDFELTIDQEHGFCPTKFVVRSRTDPSVQISETTWKIVAGLWLPQTFEISFDAPHAKVFDAANLEFRWEKVNQKLDEKLFEFTSFTDIPEGVKVVDVRVAGNPTLGTWDGNGGVIPEPKNGLEPPVIPPKRGSIIGWWICGGVVVLLVFALQGAYRKRHTSSTAS